MKTATIKLNLIERLMRVENTSTLEKIEQLMIQAEMESRAEESLKAVEEGEVVSIDDFQKENRNWVAKKYTK